MTKETIASLKSEIADIVESYSRQIDGYIKGGQQKQQTFDERGKRIAEYERTVAEQAKQIAALQARADRVTYLEGMIAGFERVGVLPPRPAVEGDFPSEDSYGRRGTIWKGV